MAPDSDFDVLGDLVEREGTETLLPSAQRSVLGTKSYVAEPLPPPPPGRAPVVAVTSLPGVPSSVPAGPLTGGAGVASAPPQAASAPAPVVKTPGPITAILSPAEQSAAANFRAGSVEDKRGARQNDVIGGRYVVEGQLGRGGMGRVLRVRHQALGKAFALKVIKSAIATNPRIRELFYREARLASALTHDNICSIVDFGQDEQFGLFMVMELLEGQTVHAKLRQGGKLPAKVACDIMWQACDALRFIHSRSIIHGDIKTENMFLVRTAAQRRIVKLLDFGLARADLGLSEGVDGTPEYLAPERIDGAPASQASDIYALGIVFFEMLTGKLPFGGDIAEVFRQQRTVELPCVSKLLEESIDVRVDDIVARATAKDPAKRYRDVATMMFELRALMQMLGMDQNTRRRVQSENPRERKENTDHRVKAAAEVFNGVTLPMAAVDATGKVRAANNAFLSFVGAAGDAGGLELRDSALPEVFPTLFEDLAEAATARRPLKRVIYLNEGGDRVVEAAIVLSAAPSGAEVTAGEVFIVIHPLRALST